MGVVAMMLMLGGGVFAYSTYKQNRPHPMWVPLPLNPALPGEKRQEILKELTAKLKDEALLLHWNCRGSCTYAPMRKPPARSRSAFS